jgi:lipopolysaccharide biosynthesis regulator YciM
MEKKIMKVTMVTVGAKVRLSQDYQSAEGSCELTAELEENEDPHQAYKQLQKAVKAYAANSVRETLRAALGGYQKEGDDL